MGRFRALLTLTLAVPTLAVLILLTLSEVARTWREGVWHKEIVMTELPGEVIEVRVVEPTVTALDWLLFIAFYGAVIALSTRDDCRTSMQDLRKAAAWVA